MDPILRTALDNQDLMLARQGTMVVVLCVLTALVVLKTFLTVASIVVTTRVSRRMDDMTREVGVLLQVIKAEGAMTDTRKDRSVVIQAQTEKVLTQIQQELPRVAHEVVREVVAGGLAAGQTPGEGTIPVVRVVVTNPADQPVPVAEQPRPRVAPG